MALWDLASPIFLGTFAAIVAVMLLANRGRVLLRGPSRLVRFIIGGGRYGGGCGGGGRCGMCGGKHGRCGCGGKKTKGWTKGWDKRGDDGWAREPVVTTMAPTTAPMQM